MSRVFERVSTRETGEDWNLTAITPQHMRLIRVIEPLVRFEITSMNSNQNCTTWGSITTLLHPFWNHPNTGLGKLKHFEMNESDLRSDVHYLGSSEKQKHFIDCSTEPVRN